ncbi:putative PAZ domain-containing protein [Helianthus annuus]|nr:putative PAZ domain-containing protein [Helianthus annuus]
MKLSSGSRINAKLSTLSVTEHSKDGVANALVPIKRPDHGTLAMRSVKLVNHFSIKFDPSNTILRYDVDIQQAVEQEGSSSTRVLKKKKRIPLRQIQEKLCSNIRTGFRYSRLLTTVKRIFSVQSHCKRNLQCSVRWNAVHVPRDVLQALDVVMKANLFREKVSVGRGMYPRVHRREDDLRCGVAAYRGSQQSLKVTSNGLKCNIFVSTSMTSQAQGIGSKLWRQLTGLKVTVTHRRTKQKYTVFGLSEKPTKDISFVQEDLEGKKAPQVVMLTDYFREKWDKEIVHKGIPCLQLGTVKRPNYVPMEFCVLAEDRRFPKEQLSKEVARRLKDLSLLAPDKRMNETCGIVREEYAIGKPGYCGGDTNFGIGVSMNMTEVDGRVMDHLS